MLNEFSSFERIVRSAHLVSDEEVRFEKNNHPFTERNIHPKLPNKIKLLFDDGHYADASFNAFKYLDRVIARIASNNESGYNLMMQVFSEKNPQIRLNNLSNQSETDEQQGYKFIFAGSMLAIRNPRGHEYTIIDDIDSCLDHLALVSLLIRKIEQAGCQI